MTGPVQVLVVGFDRPAFTGEVMAELGRLAESGTVRVLDVLLVSHGTDGFETLPLPGDTTAGLGDLAAGVLGVGDDEVAGSIIGNDAAVDGRSWSLAEAIPVGTTAAVALIEHLWAAPLRDAIRRAGGAALDETWLAPADVERLDRLVAERIA
jgi:hypothetical protein